MTRFADTKTISKQQEALGELHPDIIGFIEEVAKKFPNVRYTSGLRPRAFTKQGKVSRHATGEAVDAVAEREFYNFLTNDREGISLMNKYNLGILDETSAEMLAKTGGTGAHYHIGKDMQLVAQTKARFNKLGEMEVPKRTKLELNENLPVQYAEQVQIAEKPKEEDEAIDVAKQSLELKMGLKEQLLTALQQAQIQPLERVVDNTPQQIEPFRSPYEGLMQDGGTYQDSLRLYSKGEKERKLLRNSKVFPFNPDDNLKETDFETYKEYLKTGIMPTKEYTGSFYGNSNTKTSNFVYGYDKPKGNIQKQIIKRDPLIPIQQTPTQGIIQNNQEISTPSTEIPQKGQMPKYWDVIDTNNQRFGGGSTEYKVTPETLNTVRELPKELWTREVKPRYQDGGTKLNQKELEIQENIAKLKKLDPDFVKNLISKKETKFNNNLKVQDNTSINVSNRPNLEVKKQKNKLPDVKFPINREKEIKEYYNPEKLDNISSGDWKQDLLYSNDWLMDLPIVGDYIKDKAKNVAIASGGNPTVDLKELNKRGQYLGDTSEMDIPNLGRATLIDQYFSDKDLLAKSKYRPTSDYLTFLPSYSVKGQFDSRYGEDSKVRETFSNILEKEGIDSKKYENFIKNKKPIYINKVETGALAQLVGADLGGHKVGVKWDNDKNLPYISLSDAWDFEPKAYSEKWKVDTLKDSELKQKENKEKAFSQSYLMHKAGNPFKIYDRFYFDPNTKEYIPDEKINKYQDGGSIVEDNLGYLNPNNWGKDVKITSPSITMKGVFEPLIGISEQTGETKIMLPNKEYFFENTESVIEKPIIKKKLKLKKK